MPWNVRGVRREARETAREAARRAGVPLGEWLNQAIYESAVDDGVLSAHADDEHETEADGREVFPYAAMNGRLDELTQQLERLRQTTAATPLTAPPLAAAPESLPPAGRDDLTSQRLADTIGRLDGRLDQLIHEGRAATSEIERRVNEVDRTLAALTRETAAPPPVAMQPIVTQPPAPPPMAAPVSTRTAAYHTPLAPPPMPQAPPVADTVPVVPVAPVAPKPPGGPNFLEKAIAEIAARQRALDAEPAYAPTIAPPTYTPPPPAPNFVPQNPVPQNPASQFAAPPLQPAHAEPAPQFSAPHAPSPDLSGLEKQLKLLTAQIETLRQPPQTSAFEEAIAGLRADLAEISRTLTDAMPRRAVESLEGEVRALAARVVESRQCGADTSTLSTIERGLGEVRDALRNLTPAENLVGLGHAVETLSQKIDLIGNSNQDAGALAQLESAISGLRGIVTHVASNDSLNRLQEEVRGLAAKIDQVTSQSNKSDTLSLLEQRISSLANTLESRQQGGEVTPPQYDAIVASLVDKIEKVQLSRGDHMALGHLENRIAQLVERLDASDQRFGHLESIERGLVDLLVHLEEMRSAKGNALRSANDKPPVVDVLKQDIATLQARTQEKLEDVHGTIEKVVDRLAMIESGLRNQPQPPAPPSPPQPPAQPPRQSQTASAPPPPMPPAPQLEPAPSRAPQASAPQTPMPEVRAPQSQPPQVLAPPVLAPPVLAPPAPAPQAAAPKPAPLPPPTRAAAPQPGPQPMAPPQATGHHGAPRPPIDPNLPPDHPLEPGSRRPAGSAAERIADSEAALGPARPPVIDDPGGRSNFIAAARRAAQAAAAEMPDRPAYRGEPGFAPATAAGDSEPLGKSLSSRVKMMFTGASVVMLAAGVTYGVSGLFSEPNFDRVAELSEPATISRPAQTGASPDRSIIAAAPSKPFEAAPLPSAGTLPGSRTNSLPTAGVLSMVPPPAVPAPSLSSLSVANADRSRVANAGDVTGSVPPSATTTPSNHATHSVPAVPYVLPGITAPQGTPGTPATGAVVLGPTEEPPAAIGGATLRSAAAKGDPAAAYEVAVRFADGAGVTQDYAQAAAWFERAASQGLAPAQFRLGSLYEKGQGVKKDLQHARKLYVAAADQGNAKAMHNLAVLHAEGIDGKPDYKVASGWFRKAASRDVSDSQYNLGILYARGIGIEQNMAESYKWFALAARQGDKEAARKRDDVAARLDTQTLQAAKLAVQTWTAEPQPDAAVNVRTPPGGWERPSASAPKAKPRTARTTGRQEASLQ